VLEAGLDSYTADSAKFTALFEKWHLLDSDEVAEIVTYYTANRPSVIHNFPVGKQSFPLFAIVLGDQSESTGLLEDQGGFIELDDALADGEPDLADSEMISTFEQSMFNILILSEHADVTLWLYHLAKDILLAGRRTFTENNVFNMKLGGADLAPDTRYEPAFLFRRILRFSCEAELMSIGPKVGRGSKVGGMHTSGGSDSSVGGVKTLVTTGDLE